MRAVIWISENTWEACIDRGRDLVATDAEVTLLHVAPSDVEDLATRGAARLMGRRPPPPPGPPLRTIAADEARALLEAARERFGRPADTDSRRGHVEREVLAACGDAELLVLARDGEARVGPHSLGARTRFVVDHAACQVLVVWAVELSPRNRRAPG